MACFLSAATGVTMQLQLEAEPTDSRAHCRALSSDDDSLNEGDTGDDVSRRGESISNSKQCPHEPRSSDPHPLSTTVTHSSSLVTHSADIHSSGYSSVQSSSPSSSSLLPCSLSSVPSSSSPPNHVPGFRLLVPAQGPVRRQVKRKNGAAHSGEEREEEEQEEEEEEGRVSRVTFLSLWDDALYPSLLRSTLVL